LRDVGAWVDVLQDRRAAAGPALADPQAMPSVAAMRRAGAVVWVRLMCPGKNACHGKVVLRNRTGREVVARAVKLKSSTTDVVSLRVREVTRARGRLGVTVKPA
jgi:hypothetical protein